MSIISVLFSLAIFLLIVAELWTKRANLNFVVKIYFKSGITTYLRAFAILLITLTVAAITSVSVPDFMKWGWTNLISDTPSNVLLQPFDTIEQLSPSPQTEVSPKPKAQVSPPISAPIENQVTSPGFTFDLASVLTIIFWFVLVVMVPFWANLEEKIFRKGANSWKQISMKSLLFGLVHLIAGIPLYMGFVLAVPGFLFACRYKYVHDKSLKKTKNEFFAQIAGVEASTADHAVYNAILITLLVTAILLS